MKIILTRIPEDLSSKLKALSTEREVSMNALIRELIVREVGEVDVKPLPEKNAAGRAQLLLRMPSSLSTKLEVLSTRRSMTKSAYLRYLIHSAYNQNK
jgi:predicted DNA-binding protein